MEENPYRPSTLDINDTSCVPILNRLVCYALGLASAGGFLFAVLLVLGTVHQALRFVFVPPASMLFTYGFSIAAYVGISYGFIVAVKKSLRMEVRPAFKWLAACALSLGFIMRFASLIEWAFRTWGGLLGVVALFGVCLLFVYWKSSFRTSRSKEDEATLAGGGGTGVQNQRVLNGPTLHCALCAKEVQVDEDERCTECGWPI